MSRNGVTYLCRLCTDVLRGLRAILGFCTGWLPPPRCANRVVCAQLLAITPLIIHSDYKLVVVTAL